MTLAKMISNNHNSIICKIADLITEVPTANGLAFRCRDYLYEGEASVDIVIREEWYRPQNYPVTMSKENVAYMESGCQFYVHLLEHDGLYLHSSAVEIDGKAYLFSGNCGAGKSTHTRLWETHFGERAQVFNDDKPALRRLEDRWYAYGTPWCGKDGINQNKSVPLAGICFLKKADHNKIRKLNQTESIQKIMMQTIRRYKNVERLDLMLQQLENLVKEIPVFELENKPEEAAAILSFERMSHQAEELGL